MRGRVICACAIVCGLFVALLVPGVVRADIGIPGPAYTGGTSGPPTTSKPESKLWFNDGFWWAVMAKWVSATNNDDDALPADFAAPAADPPRRAPPSPR